VEPVAAERNDVEALGVEDSIEVVTAMDENDAVVAATDENDEDDEVVAATDENEPTPVGAR
jgi:hypothetical protein